MVKMIFVFIYLALFLGGHESAEVLKNSARGVNIGIITMVYSIVGTLYTNVFN